MNTYSGGPAFPRAAFAPDGVTYDDCGIHDSQEGMSLRDYFAGQALAGLVPLTLHGLRPDEMAEAAYRIADAMIEQSVKAPAKEGGTS